MTLGVGVGAAAVAGGGGGVGTGTGDGGTGTGPCPAADSWEAVGVAVSPGLLDSSRQIEDCDCLLETEPTFALPGRQPWKPNTVF